MTEKEIAQNTKSPEILTKILEYKNTIVLYMDIKLVTIVLLYLMENVESRESINYYCNRYNISFNQDFVRYLNFFENN